MEGETELVTIPLSKYESLVAENRKLKAEKEQVAENATRELQKRYDTIIGEKITSNRVKSILYFEKSLMGYINSLENSVENYTRSLYSQKRYKQTFRDVIALYNIKIESLKWWNIIKKRKVRREIKLLEELQTWMYTNT